MRALERQAWEKRQRQWERFHAWEEGWDSDVPPGRLEVLSDWLADAWEVAARFDPAWLAKTVDLEKVRRVTRERAMLATIKAKP